MINPCTFFQVLFDFYTVCNFVCLLGNRNSRAGTKNFMFNEYKTQQIRINVDKIILCISFCLLLINAYCLHVVFNTDTTKFHDVTLQIPFPGGYIYEFSFFKNRTNLLFSTEFKSETTESLFMAPIGLQRVLNRDTLSPKMRSCVFEVVDYELPAKRKRGRLIFLRWTIV